VYHSFASRKLSRLRKASGSSNRGDNKRSRAYVKHAGVVDSTDKLAIILFQAERAWATAMEIKADGGNKGDDTSALGHPRRHAFVARLKKAVMHAAALAAVCAAPLAVLPEVDAETGEPLPAVNPNTEPLCDAKSATEALAYHASLSALLATEQSRWQQAAGSFSTCLKLLKSLAAQGSKTDADMYAKFVADYEPMFRYAKFKMQESGETFVGDPDDVSMDGLSMEDGGSERNADGSYAFRGKNFVPESKDMNAKLAKICSNIDLLRKKTSESDEGTDEEGVERAYVAVLTSCDDALDVIERDKAAALALGGDSNDLDTYEGWVKYEKIKTVMHRGEMMVKGLDDDKPEDVVHVYDSLLHNSKELLTVGGGAEGDAFETAAKASTLRFRALRCHFIGLSFTDSGNYAKAISIFRRAQTIATEAATVFQSLDGANDADERMQEMADLELTITAAKSRAEALAYLDHVSSGTSKSLLDRLDQFDSGRSEVDGKINVAHTGLQLKRVCPKPTFFDIAYNYVGDYPDLLGEDDDDEDGEGGGSSDEEGRESSEAEASGGLLSWFTGR
jgi:signal recognition particle subunit SRP68